jgi:hypothetical protein
LRTYNFSPNPPNYLTFYAETNLGSLSRIILLFHMLPWPFPTKTNSWGAEVHAKLLQAVSHDLISINEYWPISDIYLSFPDFANSDICVQSMFKGWSKLLLFLKPYAPSRTHLTLHSDIFVIASKIGELLGSYQKYTDKSVDK